MVWYNSAVQSAMETMVIVFQQIVFQQLFKIYFNLQIQKKNSWKNNYLWTYTVLIKTHLNLYFVPLDNSAVSICVTGKCPILFLLMTINYKGHKNHIIYLLWYKLKGKATSVLLAVNESWLKKCPQMREPLQAALKQRAKKERYLKSFVIQPLYMVTVICTLPIPLSWNLFGLW